MITPAYSFTATERVLPRLALDFTTASLDSRVTVTRTLNTATRFNSTGAIELVNANLPRFDYNPSTLVCRGLLIEESRSNGFFNSVLAKSGSLPSSWSQSIPGGTQDTTTSIYGSSDGSTAWTQTANNERPFFIPNGALTISANTSYFLSLYLETNPNGFEVRNVVNYNSLPSGTAQWYIDGVAVSNTTIPTAPCRVGILFSVGATGGTIYPRIGIGGQALATGTIKFSRPQWEIGAFATSYIPTTTTAPVTRNADVASMTGTNFSSWYNATEGTFYSEFDLIATTTAGGGVAFMATDGTKNGYGFYKGSVSSSISTIVGANTSVIGSVTVGDIQKAILGYNSTNIRSILNRNGLFTTATGSVGTLSRLNLGRSWYAGDFMAGHIRKINYWPQKLTDAELTANAY